jgi:hypothetical protein
MRDHRILRVTGLMSVGAIAAAAALVLVTRDLVNRALANVLGG